MARTNREELVDFLKVAGETITERANDIIGDNRFVKEYTVTICMDFGDDFIPDIKSSKTFFPTIEKIESILTRSE